MKVEDGKLDKVVKSGDIEADIDCELDVNVLPVVDSRVVVIFVVFGGHIVEKDVIIEDGKLERDVKSEDAVIEVEINSVDTLPVVDSRVVG